MAALFNILAIASVCATGFLYWYGMDNGLYWYYPWLDAPTHLLGGLTAGFWAAAVATRLKMLRGAALVLIVLIVLAAGIGWEVWEAWAGLAPDPKEYWADTLQDLLTGVVGGVVAWGCYALVRVRRV